MPQTQATPTSPQPEAVAAVERRPKNYQQRQQEAVELLKDVGTGTRSTIGSLSVPLGEFDDEAAKGSLERLRQKGREKSEGKMAEAKPTGEAKASEPETAAEGEPKEPETEATEGQPKTLKDLAEKLGVNVKDLYGITVNIDSGGETRTLTLGQLKDTYDERQARIESLVAERIAPKELQLAEKVTQHDLDVMRARQQLELLVKMLPAQALDQRVLAQVKAEHEAYNVKESARMFELIPEWKDETLREKDLLAMEAHVGPYGFTNLRALNDARMIKYVRDNWQREERVKASVAKVQEVKPVPKVAAHTPRPPVIRPVTMPAGSTIREKARAIGQLASKLAD